MRLIDADAKIMAQLYDDEHEEWIQKEMTVADYLSFSDTSIPFVDAVPVVRRADCKHVRKWRSEESAKKFGQVYECAMHIISCPNPNDFCSYGKRREENRNDI